MTDVWEALAQSFEPTPDWLAEPREWVHQRAKEETWSAQREIMDSVKLHRSTAVPSCHGPGKSHIASRITGWWIDSHEPGTAMVVTTAPTAHQVSAVLWRYIRQLHTSAGLDGQINRSPLDQWYIGNDLVGYGRRPADYDQSSFQGIHAPGGVLIVVDEANGIPRWLWDAADSLATDEESRVLAIGNPDDPTSYFAQMCKPESDWHVVQIDALRTPNFNKAKLADYPLTKALMEAEGIAPSTEQISDELAKALVSPLWVEERIRRWAGVSKDAADTMSPRELREIVRRRTHASPLFLSKVRGIFPTDASTGTIPLGWVQLAVNRWRDWVDAGRPAQKGRRITGVDVAREGEDETCIAVRQGDVVMDIHRFVKQDTMETVDDVVVYTGEPGSLAVVDVIGVGAGVVDRLRQMKRKGEIEAYTIDFNASANSGRVDRSGEFKFRNDRAAGWWRLRELLDPSRGATLALPDDESLIEELTAVHHKVANGGVIVIEEKADIKKRLGRSTDSADAVVAAVWVDGPPIDTTQTGVVPWGGSKQPAAAIPYSGGGTFADQFEGVGAGWDT